MTYTSIALLGAISGVICVVWFLIVNMRKLKPGVSAAHLEERFSAVASSISELNEADDMFKLIGEEIHKVCGNSFILIQSYDRLYDQFYFKGIYGISSLVQKGLQMLTDNYVNASFKLDDEAKKHILNGDLKEFEGGLYRAGSGKIPKEMCREVERFFKMNKFYAMGLVLKGQMFGNVIIIPLFGNKIEDEKKLEAGITLISEALHEKLGSK